MVAYTFSQKIADVQWKLVKTNHITIVLCVSGLNRSLLLTSLKMLKVHGGLNSVSTQCICIVCQNGFTRNILKIKPDMTKL